MRFRRCGPDVFTYLHGPGGVGKSALLEALAWEATTIDRRVVWVDCADCETTAFARCASVLPVRNLPPAGAPAVARAFLRVTNLLAEPQSLLAPAIAVRVLRPAA